MINVNLYWQWEETKPRQKYNKSHYINVVDGDEADVAIIVDYGWSGKYPTTPDEIGHFAKSLPHKYKILVHLEPQSLMIDFYNWSKANEDLFDLIFVHYPTEHIHGGNNTKKYRYYKSTGDTWIIESDRKIYPKSKNITAIWSNKNWLHGHAMRHQLRNLLATTPGIVDLNNPIEKIDGLRDYRFEIAIDNEDSFATSEKFLDCVLTGTIPIIWSTKDHPQWESYDTSGIIFFQTVEEVYAILTSGKLNKEYYDSCSKAITHNFHQANKDVGLWNILYESGLKELIKLSV